MPLNRERSGRKELSLIMGLVAIIFYSIGLLSPLTPSESGPSLTMLLLFVGIPLALIVGGILTTQLKIIKSIIEASALGEVLFSTDRLIGDPGNGLR